MRPHPVPTRSAVRRHAVLLLGGAVVVLAGCSSGDGVTTVPGGAATTDLDGPVGSDDPASVTSLAPPTSVSVPTTGKPAPTTGPTATGAAAEADLTVVVDDGAGTATTSTLICDAGRAGGTLPTAAAACAALAEVGARAFEEPPADQMCTEIYGGPQTATVVGTFAGASVDVALSRTNGCEIGRWDELSALVGSAGDVDS